MYVPLRVGPSGVSDARAGDVDDTSVYYRFERPQLAGTPTTVAGTRHLGTQFSYSKAVEAGDSVFLGHHRGYGRTFEEELDDAVAAVAATLADFGLGLDDLVRVNVWLRNIGDVPAMENRFRDYFPTGVFPARMSATTDFFDADCRVMVEGIAHRSRTV